MPTAIIRHHIEKITGVARTLVVEVEFDMDPNSYEFRRSVLDAIQDTACGVVGEETTMAVSLLKIVPAN